MEHDLADLRRRTLYVANLFGRYIGAGDWLTPQDPIFLALVDRILLSAGGDPAEISDALNATADANAALLTHHGLFPDELAPRFLAWMDEVKIAPGHRGAILREAWRALGEAHYPEARRRKDMARGLKLWLREYRRGFTKPPRPKDGEGNDEEQDQSDLRPVRGIGTRSEGLDPAKNPANIDAFEMFFLGRPKKLRRGRDGRLHVSAWSLKDLAVRKDMRDQIAAALFAGSGAAVRLPDQTGVVDPGVQSALDAIEAADTVRVVDEITAALPPPWQAAIDTLRNGLTQTEAARRHGVSQATVARHVKRLPELADRFPGLADLL